jgi:SulP family sulfate permease
LVEALEDQLPRDALVLDLKNVLYLDSTGAEALEKLTLACRHRDVRLIVSGLMNQPRDIATRTGLLALFTQQAAEDVQPDLARAMQRAVATMDTPQPDRH